MSPPRKALIIEDDGAIIDLIRMHLGDQGYETTSFRNGSEGLEIALSNRFDLIILDIMLPGLDGLSICRKIRERDEGTPILMLTAKTDEIDKIVGLEVGADDYVTKPFSIRELIARVRALQRRAEARNNPEKSSAPRISEFGELRIDAEQRIVQVRGEKVDLTAKEFDLLKVMGDQPGRAFTREELLEQVWGYRYGGYSHTVNSHINRLRSKIEADPASPDFIKTVWGFGYRLAVADESGEE